MVYEYTPVLSSKIFIYKLFEERSDMIVIVLLTKSFPYTQPSRTKHKNIVRIRKHFQNSIFRIICKL